jgi:hypothetical protein
MFVVIFTGMYIHSHSLCGITGTSTFWRTLAASPLSFVLPHPDTIANLPGRTVFLFSLTGFTFLLTENGCDTCRKSQTIYSLLDTYLCYPSSYYLVMQCHNPGDEKLG